MRPRYGIREPKLWPVRRRREAQVANSTPEGDAGVPLAPRRQLHRRRQIGRASSISPASVSGASSSRAPLPSIRRLASLPEAARPERTRSCDDRDARRRPRPRSARASAGRRPRRPARRPRAPSPRPPRPPPARAAAPVTSLASTILAALISDPAERAQTVAFVDRQFGVELQEPADVGVGRVAPELPELVGREHVGVQPDRAAQPSCPSCGRPRWSAAATSARRSRGPAPGASGRCR